MDISKLSFREQKKQLQIYEKNIWTILHNMQVKNEAPNDFLKPNEKRKVEYITSSPKPLMKNSSEKNFFSSLFSKQSEAFKNCFTGKFKDDLRTSLRSNSERNQINFLRSKLNNQRDKSIGNIVDKAINSIKNDDISSEENESNIKKTKTKKELSMNLPINSDPHNLIKNNRIKNFSEPTKSTFIAMKNKQGFNKTPNIKNNFTFKFSEDEINQEVGDQSAGPRNEMYTDSNMSQFIEEDSREHISSKGEDNKSNIDSDD